MYLSFLMYIKLLTAAFKMPKKCSVPSCRGNYDSENKVHVFSFPRNEEISAAWIRAIPRKDFVYTKNSRVS